MTIYVNEGRHTMREHLSSHITDYMRQLFGIRVLKAATDILQDLDKIPYFNKGNDPAYNTQHIASLLITCLLLHEEEDISTRYIQLYLEMPSDQGSWYESFSEELARLLDSPKSVEHLYCVHLQPTYPYAEIWKKRYVQDILYYYKNVYKLEEGEIYSDLDDSGMPSMTVEKITKKLVRVEGPFFRKIVLDIS